MYFFNTIFNSFFLLFRDCKLVPLLGFDCEWMSYTGSHGPCRRPVAVLQLESYFGVCALIQLRFFSRSSTQWNLLGLRHLLEDINIIKIGVAPQKDANFLFQDMGIEVRRTYDLRFMAQMAGFDQPGGLKKMCENYLNIQNSNDDKDYCMHYLWEDECLSAQAIQYAADDVHRSIDLFDFFAEKIQPKSLFEVRTNYMNGIINQCIFSGYLNYYYESCFNQNYKGPSICEDFKRIHKVYSEESKKMYEIPWKHRCFVCKFYEMHHDYFPCK